MDVTEKNQDYRKRIIKQLYVHKSLSCTELSERINKSIPVTNKMLTELTDAGIVSETGFAASTGGRRPVMYTLVPDVMYMVAVAMDQFITNIAIVDLHNKYVTGRKKFSLPLENNPGALQELNRHIATVIADANVNKDKIIGIGIGMPGFVDFIKGNNYTFFNKGEGSIAEILSASLQLPVFIDNDSSLIALAELKFGCLRGKKNGMVINASWGVGLGLILNGELFRGHNGFAGEFSHIPLFDNNKLCECGKTGCLETEASLLVVIEKAQKALKTGKPSSLKQLSDSIEQASNDIIEAACRGDQLAVNLLSESAYTIGRGVAILIHILNPEMIVLSGRASMAGKIWLAPIQQALNEHCIPRLGANTEIEISKLGYDAELIGAAALVMEHYDRDIHRTVAGPEENAVYS